ncbi:MAG: hypothetical protein GWN86_31105 [Desulfobacterales bacterium]|nr:hypothetical protein [Desulfobacterales bacterium]
MSVFKGLKKITEAAVDVVMVIPDAAADIVLQEWHDPDTPSRTGRRLKRVVRRTVEGAQDVYHNAEDNDGADLSHLRDNFSDEE